MRRKILPLLFAAAVLVGTPFFPSAAWAQPASGPTQTSSARGVTVKVTPRSMAEDAPTWSFAIVLDTHTQDLADDLLQTTELVTEDGRALKPSGWEGAAPGGHHREGLLEFAAPRPAPRSFELRMRRIGETQARTFRFTASP